MFMKIYILMFTNVYVYENIYINVYQCICFHIYAINVQMKKKKVVFLTLNYVEKIMK